MSKKKNPFQEMENEQIRSFDADTQRRVKSSIDGTVGTSRMLGNITEVYLSRFIDTVFGMSADRRSDSDQRPGRSNQAAPSNKKYPNL